MFVVIIKTKILIMLHEIFLTPDMLMEVSAQLFDVAKNVRYL